jgi:hypothetical protein
MFPFMNLQGRFSRAGCSVSVIGKAPRFRHFRDFREFPPPYPLPSHGPAQAVRPRAFPQKAVRFKGFANDGETESFRQKFANILKGGPDDAGIGKTGTPVSRHAVCPDPAERLPYLAGYVPRKIFRAQIHHLPEKM